MVLKHVCDCKDCQEQRLNEQKHLQHQFYRDVTQFWNETRREQILKGSHKYKEPFNPDSWTNEQLAQHAMQENFDQGVYITGMRDRLRKQEQTIIDLKDRIHRALNFIDYAVARPGYGDVEKLKDILKVNKNGE